MGSDGVHKRRGLKPAFGKSATKARVGPAGNQKGGDVWTKKRLLL